MARPLRIEFDGALYHVTSRSNVREPNIYYRFTLYDELSPKLIWMKGHTLKKDRVGIQRIFLQADRSVRNLLRNYIARKFS